MKNILIISIIILLTPFSIAAQVLYNNGTTLHLSPGAVVQVNGSMQNQSGGTVNVSTAAEANLNITGDLTNNGTINGNGNINLQGNWINNSVFNCHNGLVFLNGNNQNLGGTVSTTFYNLTLNNSSIKSLLINQTTSGTLSLNNAQLATDIYTMFVTNTAANAIQRTTGFVSSNNGGYLSRATASTSTYLFPVGSTTRYRPVELAPASAANNTYVVRFANVDATSESYDRSKHEAAICEVNPNFYHQINRTAGSDAANMKVYFLQSEDGSWEKLGTWRTAPATEWYNIATSNIVTVAGLSHAAVNNWNNFSQIPYALTRGNPVINLGNDTTICSNSSVTLNPGTGFTSYLWTGGSTNQTLTVNTTGKYGVTVHSGSCSATDSINITVIPMPVVNLGPDTTICAGESITLDAGAGASSYSWNTGSTNQTITVNTSNTYSVVVTNGGLCSSNDQIVVTVSPVADATITNPGPLCSNGAAINLTAATAGGTWSGNGITNATNGTFNPSVAGVGTHTITYTISGNCGDTKTTQITVNQSANATINPSGPYCISDAPVNLTAADAGGTWSGNGITDATVGTFNPATAGAGTHTITYTIAGACGDTKTTQITVNNQADATITPVADMCDNSPSITLTAVDAGGTWSGNGITNPTNGTFDPATAGVGTHQITYTISGNCGDVDNIMITVNQSYDATINPSGPYCILDAPVNLTAADAGGTWSGNGITDATAGTFNPATAGVGTHTITYTISGACGDTKTAQITVINQANATITPVADMCDNSPSITLTAVDAGGTWSGNGVNAIGTFNPNIAGAGTHQITYTISGSCGDTDNIMITVNQSPTVSIHAIGETCQDKDDGIAWVVINGGTPPYNILWSNNETTDTISPLAPGIYNVTISDTKNCGNTLNIDLAMSGDLCYNPAIWVPNVFSPNDDGQNDILFVEGEGVAKLLFVIYDRWGEKIFESKSMDDGWDGKYKGVDLDPGVFFYYVKATFDNNSVSTLEGNVTLIK